MEFEILYRFPNIRHAIYTGQNIPDKKNIALHLGIKKVINPNQKHGINICSYPNFSDDFNINCDAVVTQEKEIGLLIRHANCQAALFFDPVTNRISNIHCGWRGNIQMIYTKTVEYLQNTIGCNPKN